jgi:hypothetical protein
MVPGLREEVVMKRIVMIVAVSAALCSSAFAGGSKNALSLGAVVNTGKGGLVGTLLGSNSGHGSTGVAAGVNVNTGKGGILGTVLGSNSGHGTTGVGVGVNVNTGKGGVLGLLTGSQSSSHHGW